MGEYVPGKKFHAPSIFTPVYRHSLKLCFTTYEHAPKCIAFPRKKINFARGETPTSTPDAPSPEMKSWLYAWLQRYSTGRNTLPYAYFTSQTRTRQDKTVLSCPCRQCEMCITFNQQRERTESQLALIELSK